MANDSAKKAAINAAAVKELYTKIIYGIYVGAIYTFTLDVNRSTQRCVTYIFVRVNDITI
jgi:hypothetical protein